jgi:hypothetical protein
MLMSESLIETWRQIIIGEHKSWALFSNGTCVILMQPEADLKRQALELMKTYGPVHSGTPAGDFSVITLEDDPGWVVTSHHPDILTYVSPDEVADQSSDLVIGLLGRSKRDQDAAELTVIHVEDNRNLIMQ